LNNVITGHLGQPVAMFNASGTLVWRGVVDGYDIAAEVESTPLKMRFPGQYAILGNGLYYGISKFILIMFMSQYFIYLIYVFAGWAFIPFLLFLGMLANKFNVYMGIKSLRPMC
jgi:hypothetical protein